MNKRPVILFILMTFITGCVVQFIPDVDEEKEYLVVEGLITNQEVCYKVKVSRASNLGVKNTISPVKGALVIVKDDFGNAYPFAEKKPGLYVSDSIEFRGRSGRKYSLHITDSEHSYESDVMEMRAVPEIDSIYADLEYNPSYSLGNPVPGYQVYLNTGDPSGQCNFYRWNYEETWEFRIPYVYPSTIKNRICWKHALSDNLYLKNATTLKENKITSFPLNFITTETDRLKVRYSILLNQYSLNEKEYLYWEKIQKVTGNVGGLYDVIPSSIRGNLYCSDDPSEKVLGYFSVSSVTSRRLFIENKLINFPDFYSKCPVDTVPVSEPISALNTSVFIIALLNDFPPTFGSFYVLTDKKECIDCTLNGSNIMPPYWNLPKKQTIFHYLFNEK